MNPPRITPRILAPALFILVPACGGGGGGGGGGSSLPSADPIQSSFTADVVFGTPADGLSQVQFDLTLADQAGQPLEGVTLELRVSGFSNQVIQPDPTDEEGRARGFLSSTVSEAKDVQVLVTAGARLGEVARLSTEFVRLLPDTYFLRQGGSDANSGAAPLEAWATLQYALDQLQPGDTLHVGAGSYLPSRLSVVASELQPVHVLADTEGLHTGDAGRVEVNATGFDFGLMLDAACALTVRGFHIYGANPGANFGGGIWISDLGSEDVSLIDCRLYENTRGLEVQRAAELVVEGCSISNNVEDGIRMGLTVDSNILNNLIYNNGGSGLNIVRLTGGLQVGLNTFYANQGPHLSESLPAGSQGSSAYLSGNLFMEGGEDSLQVSSSSLGLFDGDVNLSFGNRRSGGGLPSIGVSIVDDPLLIDVDGADDVLGGFGHADDDFSLPAASVAVDSGIINSNQLMLSSSGTAASKSSIAGGLLDGEGSDGARINLGYHSPSTVPAYSSALPNDTRISYVQDGEASIRTSVRPQLAEQWGAGAKAQITNAGIKWLVHRLAPEGPEELMATLVDTGMGSELYVRHWDGRRWSENLDFPVVTTIDRANVGERGFDLVYEQDSGDALFVRSNNDSIPVFRTLSAGVWSDAAPVFGSALGSGVVLWVELIPERGSDRVAMVALDDSEALTAAVWNGQAWEAPVLLGTQIVEMREFNSFAGVWESLSGNLMVMWGFSIYAEQARYAVYSQQTKTWSGTQLYTNSEAVGSVIRMRADPNSDRIALAWGEGHTDDDVVVSTWNGNRFTNTRELSLTGENGQHGMQVGWIGKTGKAFAIYRKRNANDFERARFDRFWKFESPMNVPLMGKSIRAEILSDAGEDFAEVIILDENGSLFGFEVRFEGTGTVWTQTNSGQPLAVGLSLDRSTHFFSAAHRRALPEPQAMEE